MNIEQFIALRPYLFHLTDEKNVTRIMNDGRLYSAATLARKANIGNVEDFLRTRRVGHVELKKGQFYAKLRDQDPLFRRIVEKNLTDGWTFEDFVYSLNSRVFFWCTETDLRKHFLRYEKQNEFPRILRFRTDEIFTLNDNKAEFCRLNSGAPRCSSHYVKGAPPRGPKTFQGESDYIGGNSSIREVTFLDGCMLPSSVWVSRHPESTFKKFS